MCIDNAENQYEAASLDAERVALQAMELFPDMEPEALRLCALVTKSYGNARTEGQEPTISSKEEQLERQLQAMQMRVTELEQALVASKNEQKPKAKVKAAAAQNIQPTTTVLYMRVYLLNKNCKSSAVNCESAA